MAFTAAGPYPEPEGEIFMSLQLQPETAALHAILGSLLALEIEGNTGAAAEFEYQEAIRLRPDYPEARYNLALALFARGDAAGAKAQLKLLVTSSMPAGVDAFLPSELPFQRIPTRIEIRPTIPAANPIVLSVMTQPGGPLLFAINAESTPSDALVQRLSNIFSTRQERVLWVRFADGLPSWAAFLRVMESLRAAGLEHVHLILAPKQ
jgi:biopolymer transport protein ExbD